VITSELNLSQPSVAAVQQWIAARRQSEHSLDAPASRSGTPVVISVDMSVVTPLPTPTTSPRESPLMHSADVEPAVRVALPPAAEEVLDAARRAVEDHQMLFAHFGTRERACCACMLLCVRACDAQPDRSDRTHAGMRVCAGAAPCV
jgi:hypothetical protein